MKGWRTASVAVTAMALVVLTAPMGASAPAAAGTDTGASTETAVSNEAGHTHQHCYILTDRSGTPQSKNCFEDAGPASGPALQVHAPQIRGISASPLIQFRDGANFSDDALTIYGASPCDNDGYGISQIIFDNPFVSGVSSYILYVTCVKAALWSQYHYAGDWTGVVPGSRADLGSFNDRAESAKVWSQ